MKTALGCVCSLVEAPQRLHAKTRLMGGNSAWLWFFLPLIHSLFCRGEAASLSQDLIERRANTVTHTHPLLQPPLQLAINWRKLLTTCWDNFQHRQDDKGKKDSKLEDHHKRKKVKGSRNSTKFQRFPKRRNEENETVGRQRADWMKRTCTCGPWEESCV